MATISNRNKSAGSIVRVFEFDLGFVARARLSLDVFATRFLLALRARRKPAQAGVPVLLEGASPPGLAETWVQLDLAVS